MKENDKETEGHINIQIIISKPDQWAMTELSIRSHIKNPVPGPGKYKNKGEKQIGESTSHFLPYRECLIYAGKT